MNKFLKGNLITSMYIMIKKTEIGKMLFPIEIRSKTRIKKSNSLLAVKVDFFSRSFIEQGQQLTTHLLEKFRPILSSITFNPFP